MSESAASAEATTAPARPIDNAPWVAAPGKVPVCQHCGTDWQPVRRGECDKCGSDAGPFIGQAADPTRSMMEQVYGPLGTRLLGDLAYKVQFEGHLMTPADIRAALLVIEHIGYKVQHAGVDAFLTDFLRDPVA